MNPISNNQSPSLPDDVVLSVRGVSKKFCRNLRRSMWYGMQDLGRNLLGLRPGGEIRDSRLDISSPNPQSLTPNNQSPTSPAHGGPLRRDEFWALQDINFDVKRGESVGLIGLNGSGKTTLLRLIHGIYPPDAGTIASRGRVGALIALGAGFHPHLTGRENISLNGAILGISQDEIKARLPDIIEFAGIGEFIDAPVATYSSGMRVRLGFAVAINTDPEILLIDEVLAVGDLAFRNKCIAHLQMMLAAERTVLFVSHNMGQVEHLCERCILLDAGNAVLDGSSGAVIAEYYRQIARRTRIAGRLSVPSRPIGHVYETGEVVYRDASLEVEGRLTDEVLSGGAIDVLLRLSVDIPVDNPLVYVVFQTFADSNNVAFAVKRLDNQLSPGNYTIRVRIPNLPLYPGVYRLASRIKHRDGIRKLAGTDELGTFTVVSRPEQFPKTVEAGYTQIPADWFVHSDA